MSQHHPRSRKSVQGTPAYHEKIDKFVEMYKRETLFTCPKRRRIGTGVGTKFVNRYAFIEDGTEEEETESCQKFGKEYHLLSKKLDLEKMVCK